MKSMEEAACFGGLDPAGLAEVPQEAASFRRLDPARLAEAPHEAACFGTLDLALLAEAPRLLRSASRAMEGLAFEVHSCDVSRLNSALGARRCWVEAAAPILEVLEAHLLEIWGISVAAEYEELTLQVRDAFYFIQDLQDNIHYRRFQSNPPALRWCGWNFLPFGIIASKPPKKIIKNIKVVNQETHKIGHLLDKATGSSSSTSLPPPWMPDSSREILQTTIFVGRHREKDDIVEMLIKPCAKSVISIVGDGGIGKTTLAQMVFSDATVWEHFDVRCWVTVSRSSNKMEIAAEILRSVQPAWEGSAERMMDFQMLQSELRRALISKRYLIVLDDVCNKTDEIWLDMLTLQSADTGSRIMVISRINTMPHIL
ncbi:putative disease resistance protein RGA1 [Triticum dicoccoides]|uniref:putative disease resistance protein RGA1 n=1 Tax=Triticum dicoccoides TaxID=85692 RepID=UPI001890A3F4|nr:putative disease resistance protein RGA1 [Triticum dicoccoides]